MARSTLNFFIDLVTFVVMLAMVATGLLMRFVLPPGSGERRSLWGGTRHDWGDVHFWLAAALGGLLLVHLALHWGWVCSVASRWRASAEARGRPKSALRRNLAGVTLLSVVTLLIGGFLWVADRGVVETEGGGRRLRRGHGAPTTAPVRTSDRASRSAAAASSAAAPPDTASAAAPDGGAADGMRVYYFHRTARCSACLTIENFARQAIQEQFADALEAGRLAWFAVNLDEPGNAHFEADFQFQTQSLVLAEFVDGRCVRWKNLTRVWNLLDSQPAFADYVYREVLAFGGG